MTPRRYFSAFPRTSSIILSKEVAWTTQVFSSREKADTVSDGITSSPSSHHLSPTPTNVLCSLVALLALLASILLKISSLFLFHEIPFCKFECFPCNFSRDHSGGCPGVPVHGGIPIVFTSIHGVVTQFVNVSFLCVPVHEDTTPFRFERKSIHTHGNISILASKDESLESGLNSGMRGTTVHWNKQMRFLIPLENLCKNRLCFSNVDR